MGIGPMTFSLRERRSATELNRLFLYFIYFFTLFTLERFHGVGAAYEVLVLRTPVRFWVGPFLLFFSIYFYFLVSF